MSDENQSESQSPFTRPGFIAAAIVVALIVVFGIILVIVNTTGGDSKAVPTSSATSTPSGTISSPGPATGDKSICGLSDVKLSGTVTTAPTATWKYQGVLSYPTSAAQGPGAADSSGYRYCFARTPEGALFAGANIAIMSGDSSIRSTWLPYVFSPGQYRNTLLSSAQSASDPDLRMTVAGFRMLSYDGDHALVDIAFQATGSGQIVTGSFVAQLVWAQGDWKIDSSSATPTKIDQLPNLAGYIPWTAS